MTQASVAALQSRFRAEGSKTRASAIKKYMKSDLAFHGVSQPQIRAAARDVCAEHDFRRTDLLALARGLFATRFHDLHSVAIAILERRVDLLEPRDLPWLIDVVRATANWAHVDWLAVKVIGAVLRRDATAKRRIRTWARDPHLWVRRTALLAQLDDLRHGGGDFELFERIAAPMLSETVFWIRKAIGWVLREVSRDRPALVRRFLRRHGAAMSGVTRREATKYV